MKRITKAQSRKRLLECITKMNKVHQSFHLSMADNKKLYGYAMELHKLQEKLR